MTREEIQRQITELQAMLAEPEAPVQEGTVREPSPEAIAQAREMNPIDDIFFKKRGESPEVCEEIISTVLQMPVEVIKVVPQNMIASF